MQTFFNDNPVLSGIIVFIVIAVIVVAIYLLIFFLTRKRSKAKKEQLSTQVSEQAEQLEEEVEEVEIDNNVYYIIDFNNSGNLVIKKVEDGSTNKNPTKDDMLSIINGNETRLALPENKVWISIDENNQFKTSQPLKDRNLFTYKAFLKFMFGDNDMSWAISKFV